MEQRNNACTMHFSMIERVFSHRLKMTLCQVDVPVPPFFQWNPSVSTIYWRKLKKKSIWTTNEISFSIFHYTLEKRVWSKPNVWSNELNDWNQIDVISNVTVRCACIRICYATECKSEHSRARSVFSCHFYSTLSFTWHFSRISMAAVMFHFNRYRFFDVAEIGFSMTILECLFIERKTVGKRQCASTKSFVFIGKMLL